MKRLLLISNSTNPGEEYLSYARKPILDFLKTPQENILFIPYAGVRMTFDAYEEKVNNSLKKVGLSVRSIHRFDNPLQAVQEAEVIMVGGGSTWKLVRMMRDLNLMDEIRQKVEKGTPYIGWSAGSNVACPTLTTTNDMPIIDPKGFDTINLVPFQINPHYTDFHPEGHGGETRDDRIHEFCIENKDVTVLGLREGTMLRIEGRLVQLIGSKKAKVFRFGREDVELPPTADFDFLMRSE